MKISRDKTTTTMIALFLVLTIVATFVALPVVNAHTPPEEIVSYGFVNVAPDPVGFGQTVVIVMWLRGSPYTAAGSGGDRYRPLNIEITKPNGDSEMLGPFTSDSTGSAYTLYTPDQIGTYEVLFTYPGQVLSLYGPTGIAGRNSPYINDTYLPCSAATTFTVQEEAIPEPPTYPLPTEYWTRPIEGQNTEWYRVASNWLGIQRQRYPSVYMVQPDGIAPNSAHVMWTKPIGDGGVVGGTDTSVPGMTYYGGLTYEAKFNFPMIMYGRLYYPLPLGNDNNDLGYACVDLRTGEEIYRKDMSMPTWGQIYDYHSMNQHGAIGDGYLWRTSGTTWMAYDGRTGESLFNLTDVPRGTYDIGPNGELLQYVFKYDTTTKTGWLALWNNTCEQQGLHGATGTSSSAYQWRPVGKTVNMSQAYSWNVTVTADLLGDQNPAIYRVFEDDCILGESTAFSGMLADGVPKTNYTIWAISLKPETRGQLMWKKTYTVPPGDTTLRMGSVDLINRVFVVHEQEPMRLYGYSIDDGSLVWGPSEAMHSAFDFYNRVGATEAASVYGNLYTAGYGGIIYCYSMKNGSLLWTYGPTTSGLNTVWGVNPLGVCAVADGKVYAYTAEHSPGAPYYKDARVYCVDAYTGEEVWTLMAHVSGEQGMGHMVAVASGFMVYLNTYDMQIYCIGKGPSETTVTASPMVTTKGSSVMITGSVIDLSSGTNQNEQAARFPKGVPAMSDESMIGWMEYVYMQKPIPMDASGVKVTLDAVDPNGIFINIGSATSDISGFYSYMWTPENEGKYTIIATFEGSESYWASYAETAIGVDPEPSPSGQIEPEPTEPSEAPFITTEIAIIIAVVIIAVIGVVAFWALRKRK